MSSNFTATLINRQKEVGTQIEGPSPIVDEVERDAASEEIGQTKIESGPIMITRPATSIGRIGLDDSGFQRGITATQWTAFNRHDGPCNYPSTISDEGPPSEAKE